MGRIGYYGVGGVELICLHKWPNLRFNASVSRQVVMRSGWAYRAHSCLVSRLLLMLRCFVLGCLLVDLGVQFVVEGFVLAAQVVFLMSQPPYFIL